MTAIEPATHVEPHRITLDELRQWCQAEGGSRVVKVELRSYADPIVTYTSWPTGSMTRTGSGALLKPPPTTAEIQAHHVERLREELAAAEGK